MSRAAARRATAVATLMAGVFYGAMFATPQIGWQMALGASALLGVAVSLARAVALESF